MAEIIETTGNTVEEALGAALDKLGCGRAEVTYEVIQEPSGGFLGLWGKREARIRVTTRPVILPQRTEIQTPPPPVPAAPPAEEVRTEDDGFGVRPKRFHTDLRSSARKNAAENAPRRTFGESRENVGRDSYEEARTPRENSRGGYGEPRRDYPARSYGESRAPRDYRARSGADEHRTYHTRSGIDERQDDFRPQRRERTDSLLIPLTDEMAAAAEKFLSEIFASMHLTVALRRTDTPSGTIFNMRGENLGILIGKHGSTLDALQYLTNLVVNRIPEIGYGRIILDVEDYRARREETLTRLAGHLADKACRIGEEIHLEPMSRHERKIIHMALQDNRRVTTYSAGDNPRRYVVIVPKRRRYARDYEESSYDRYER